MKVNFINSAWCNSPLKYNSSQNTPKYNTQYLSLPKDTVSFQKSSEIPPKVITYLKQRREELGDSYGKLTSYDPKKLEGIQNGIEIFDSLSFSQIVYLISNLETVILQRGCDNGCIYCYCDAKTPFYMKTNHYTDKIDFEDYKNLIDGFKELNERLDFNIFNQNKNRSLSLFHDADCSMIYLDDNGNTYDYADLAKMLHDVTGREILFDTAGWNLNDKKTQKRMEDLVQKIVNSNDYDFLKFNISLNPFHSIYNRSVELQKEGEAEGNEEKIKKAQMLKDIYIDRMANVIFTFSPLFEKSNSVNHTSMLVFIIRALVNTPVNGYMERDILKTCNKIINKVDELYDQDSMSEHPKVIKDEAQKKYYKFKIRYNIMNIDDHPILLTNKKLLNKLDKEMAYKSLYTKSGLSNSAKDGEYFKEGLIDVNGKFYVTNEVETYPTNIALNYKNKEKTTAPIEPNLKRDEIIDTSTP